MSLHSRFPVPKVIAGLMVASPESIAVASVFFFALFVSERKALRLFEKKANF